MCASAIMGLLRRAQRMVQLYADGAISDITCNLRLAKQTCVPAIMGTQQPVRRARHMMTINAGRVTPDFTCEIGFVKVNTATPVSGCIVLMATPSSVNWLFLEHTTRERTELQATWVNVKTGVSVSN
eukprot:GEMP01105243.1.p2 GENE.GEMP01105243.1~~GEMP01105243.1.p2  ORF type:complete len:127 (+),score=11.98 GEMP01105243.1:199-579(+)